MPIPESNNNREVTNYMAEEQQPEEGTAEALAQELKNIPSDRAVALAPDINERFESFIRLVYPHVITTSRQYNEMRMIWHVAYLDFLDLICDIPKLTDNDEDLGAEILNCFRIQALKFLDEYKARRDEKEGE